MTKDEALKLALKAIHDLEGEINPYRTVDFPIPEKAKAAIKEALAQPEQDPVALMMLEDCGWEFVDGLDGDWIKEIPLGTILYMHTTPPQRKPTPVKFKYTNAQGKAVLIETNAQPYEDAVPLYEGPVIREWVGLMDDEIEAIDCVEMKYIGDGEYVINGEYEFARLIETKLKEKNT